MFVRFDKILLLSKICHYMYIAEVCGFRSGQNDLCLIFFIEKYLCLKQKTSCTCIGIKISLF